MREEITLKICGEAGQGMQTIGTVLCKACQHAGYYVLANQDFMSRIRGGNNFSQIRISVKPVNAVREKNDITVALDKASLTIHARTLAPDGIMVMDPEKLGIQTFGPDIFPAPLYALAKESGGELFVNSVTCGLLAYALRLEIKYIEDVLRGIFARKTESVVRQNLTAAQKGYVFAREKFTRNAYQLDASRPSPTLLMNAGEAIGLGAIKAGCKFYSAYPMSPSTEIMNFMAGHAPNYQIEVEQAEDEIAAINMVIGASFAGVRAMTSTSGGGFALMTEGLSLAAMTETPVVIVNAQRPGPATGFPTRTEQADLNLVIHAGHGEFARVVFSPGTLAQAYLLTQKAFHLAEKYQIPVLILMDQYLADTLHTIDKTSLQDIPVERHLFSGSQLPATGPYRRYQLTETGISPRAAPSFISDVIYVDSDEHDEDGHITEEAGLRVKMVNKRFGLKMRGLADEIEKPSTYHLENAEIILLGTGSTYGVIRETADILPSVGCIHFSQVWPFPADELQKILLPGKKIITVENNAGAQLAKLIRGETGLKADYSILKYDGRPLTLEDVCQKTEEFLNATR